MQLCFNNIGRLLKPKTVVLEKYLSKVMNVKWKCGQFLSTDSVDRSLSCENCNRRKLSSLCCSSGRARPRMMTHPHLTWIHSLPLFWALPGVRLNFHLPMTRGKPDLAPSVLTWPKQTAEHNILRLQNG